MASSYEDLKAAFLALQRVAVSARAGWLDRLGADDPGLHRDLMSFLAFEVDDVAVLDPDDRTGPEPLVGTRYADRGLLGVGGIGERLHQLGQVGPLPSHDSDGLEVRQARRERLQRRA